MNVIGCRFISRNLRNKMRNYFWLNTSVKMILQVRNFVIRTYYTNQHLFSSVTRLVEHLLFTVQREFALQIAANSVRNIIQRHETAIETTRVRRDIGRYHKLKSQIIAMIDEDPELSLRK